MAFTEEEVERILEVLEDEFWSKRRPPLHLRNKVREGQRIENQAVELYFERPAFRKPDTWIEESIVKIRYVRKTNRWKLYWMRADLKWHGYVPYPEAESLSEALAVVQENEYGCFFG
ncbi:MAG: hypothetical protein CMO55_06005 [Verrucomicrobiales bacterium]|nr:hypothetical protein [Verrucomicrobiales bacterium]